MAEPQDAESLSAVPLQSPTSVPLVKKRRLNKRQRGDDVIAYLQMKQEAEAKWREEELAMKKRETWQTENWNFSYLAK